MKGNVQTEFSQGEKNQAKKVMSVNVFYEDVIPR